MGSQIVPQMPLKPSKLHNRHKATLDEFRRFRGCLNPKIKSKEVIQCLTKS